MPRIKFTSALKPFFPTLSEMDVQGATVREIINEVERCYPGISTYLMDETGSLRKHVNIFIGGDLIKDRTQLGDSVKNTDELLIFQALSGG